MLRQRVLSAALGLPLLMALIWVGGVWYSVAVGLAVLAGTAEFYRARAGWQAKPLRALLRDLRFRGPPPLWPLGLAFAPLLVAAAHFGGPWPGAALAALLVLGLLGALAGSPRPEASGRGVPLARGSGDAFSDWAWTVAGALYVGWLGSHLVLLRGLEEGRAWALIAVLGAFATDTSAYFVGRAWGRRPLASAISPGKTVEGTLGGILGGVAAVVALGYLTELGAPVALVAPLGLLLALAAIAGDLAESLFKRSVGIKEAGALIPGHGGVLDRMDSILFVAVVVYYYAVWIV